MNKSEQRAVQRLRDHIAKQEAPKECEFKPGDAVRLDNGWLGVVYLIDPIEGTITVFYLDEAGTIGGPSMGWEMELLT